VTGNVIHIDPRRTVAIVLTPERKAALAVVQNWLNQTPEGDAYLTHHSMDSRKFDLVDAIVAFAATGGSNG
jgi:hypothetical protein